MTDRRDTEALSATVSIYETTLKSIPPNIEGFSSDDAPPKDRHLFNRLFDLIDELTPEIEVLVQNKLTENPEDWNEPLTINPPRFRIVHRKDLPKVAEEIGLEIGETNQGKLNKNDWFCVFNLPQQVNQADNPDKLRRELITKILDLLEEAEESTGLTLSSLNAPNDHKTGKYDDVWAISMEPYLTQPINLS